MKTSLGIWALGSMVTRFVPGGYQPQWAGETTAERVRRAVDGLGDLIDGYEFHYPQELNAENLDEVREALGGHDIYCIATGLHLDPRFGKGGLVSPDPATRAEAVKRTLDAIDFSGELGAHFIIWPGIEGYNYPFQTPYAERWAWLVDGIGQAAQRCTRPRDLALPRAQELRAGDEDPDAQHRDDAARDPHAPRPGPRQRQGQHGLAAPAHERREPRPSTRRCSPPRACSGTSTRTRAGARSTTTTWSARPRSWRRSSWRSSCAAPATATNGERLGFDLYPYTEDAVEAVRRSVLQWRFIDSVAARIDDAALREAQMRKDAVRAYELVYAALGA